MEKTALKDAFSEFKNLKNIDRATMSGVLQDVFKSQLAKTYGTSDNFDVTINIDKGDCQILRNLEVVETVEDPATQISVEEAKAAVAAFPGVKLIEDYEGRCYPTPLDTSNQNLVWVGRIREDLTDENGLTLWCCGDQIRKGAAANAVQILCKMIEKK